MARKNKKWVSLDARKTLDPKDARIIAAANELLEAVTAAGYSIHSIPGLSGVDVDVFAHNPTDVVVTVTNARWDLRGDLTSKVTFEKEKRKEVN